MLLNRLMEILAPTSCLGCEAEGAAICAVCLSEVRTDPRRLDVGLPGSQLEGVSVGADYAGVVKELILQLKFHRLRAGVTPAAELIMRTAAGWPQLDVVTSVPVAAGRYRERGYNQSELLAREVARQTGLPYLPLLARRTATHQIGLGRHERLAQVAGAFYGIRELKGQRVLVVDDVVTTGATLSECAGALRAAGADGVWGAAVARH